MKPNLTYRQANNHDLPALKALGILSYKQFEQVLSPDNWKKLYTNLQSEHLWEELLEKAKVFVCVDQSIVGMAYFIPSGNPTPIFEATWSYVRMVGVDPSYRGQGISKQLMQQCIAYAQSTKEKTVALHTSEFMDAARHVYESLGFKKQKELAPIFEKRYWLYSLELK